MKKRVWLTGFTLCVAVVDIVICGRSMLAVDSETHPFVTLYKWKHIEFDFTSLRQRHELINTGLLIPRNVIPAGIELWGLRVFITLPKLRPGVPVTLATVKRRREKPSPALKPYPNWEYYLNTEDGYRCTEGLVSVFRVATDPCGRLWILDSGQIDIQDNPKQICPPALVVFDLVNDRFVARYTIPEELVLQDSLFTNFVVHSRTFCSDVYVYIADTWRFGLVVFRHRDQQYWRFTHNLFFPDPIASNYYLHDLNFRWTDGIFGLALSAPKRNRNRLLFFHPMSSNMEFFVETSVLQNPLRVNDNTSDFNLVGKSRGRLGQASTSAIDRYGVMYFGLVCRNTVACWDTNKFYNKETIGVVAINNKTLIFPYDIKIDRGEKQFLWVLSNKLPMFEADTLNIDEYNYRLLYVAVEEAVKGKVCDPSIKMEIERLQ